MNRPVNAVSAYPSIPLCQSPYGCDPKVIPMVPENLQGYLPKYVPGYGWTMQETLQEEEHLMIQTWDKLSKLGVTFDMNGPFPVAGMTYATYQGRLAAFLGAKFGLVYCTIPQGPEVTITPITRANNLGITPQEA